jgi:hypothetical protein
MRNGQNKRMRGRNRNKGHHGGHHHNPLTRVYESNGPDVKIRGTAHHVAEKYLQLARDAQTSGDPVTAENHFQHAEHYYRILAAAQAQMPQPQPIVRSDDDGEEDDRDGHDNGAGGERQPNHEGGQPAFGLSDPQPNFNGGDQDQPANDVGASVESGVGRDRGGHMGGFRRRRPYRERFGDRGGDHGNQGGRSDGGAGSSRADD